MKQYLDLMKHILENGTPSDDRTGTGTLSVFGYQMRFNLAEGFPLVTTKKCHLRSIIHELLWFIAGDTQNKHLNDVGVTIWDEWALKEDDVSELPLLPHHRAAMWVEKTGISQDDAIRRLNELGDLENGMKFLDDEGIPRTYPKVNINKGDIGPMYGYQWRSWPTSDGGEIDQLQLIIDNIKNHPNSRRLVVSAWNPEFVPDEGSSPQDNIIGGKGALAPCHALFQFNTRIMRTEQRLEYAIFVMGLTPGLEGDEDADAVLDGLGVPRRFLDCQLYQRSADTALGVPFNIASYALLTMMVAKVTGLAYGDFIWTGGDVHLYNNHIENAKIQIEREPRHLPKMIIEGDQKSIDDFKFEDFELVDYYPHPHIKYEIAI